MTKCLLQNSRDISAVLLEQDYQTSRQYFRSALSPFAARDILTQTVSTDLLPLHLLTCDGELSAETLECALGCLDKGPVQSFLVIALGRRNFGNNRLSGDGGNVDADGLGGVEGHIAIFIVVHIDLDLAGQGRR
jgi:hypothetical protein